jgi:hypothetical protein
LLGSWHPSAQGDNCSACTSDNAAGPPLEPQLPSNDPWAHWSAKHYNASLIPGNDCVLGIRNDKYDYFTGNSSSTTGGRFKLSETTAVH